MKRVLLVDDVATRGSTLKVVYNGLLGTNGKLEVVITTGMQMILKSTVRERGAIIRK